jgi:hypothetical protein
MIKLFFSQRQQSLNFKVRTYMQQALHVTLCAECWETVLRGTKVRALQRACCCVLYTFREGQRTRPRIDEM